MKERAKKKLAALRESQSVNLSPAPDLHTVEEANRELANECDRLAASPDDERRPAGIVGVPLDRIDSAKAVPACRAAATANPSEARITYEIARALSRTNGADAEMVSYYERAAEAGYPSAMSSLGVLFEIGRGVAKDPVKAVAWDRKAAEAGSAVGMINLGTMYANGNGVPGDFAQAMAWYTKAADAGNALGMTQVGTLYHRGEGVRLDYAQAAAWHHKAAEAGDPLGMYYCGLELLHGEGDFNIHYAEVFGRDRMRQARGSVLRRIPCSSLSCELIPCAGKKIPCVFE